MLSPARLALLLVLALLALLPARHLHLAGWSGRAVLTYYLVLLALALGAIELRPAARFLVPILIVAYLAPFVTVGDGLGRLLGTRLGGHRRPVGPRPPKDVTPPGGLLGSGQEGGSSAGPPREDTPVADEPSSRRS